MAKKKAKKKIAKTPTKKQPKITPEKQNVVPYPTPGPEIIEFEKTLHGQIYGQDQAQPKRGPGRPRKQPQPEPEPEPQIELTEKLLAQALKIPFDLWSIRVNVKELKLLDNEAAELAAPVKQLLDYYLPKMPPIVVAWVSLAFVSYSIMHVRLLILAEIRKQKATAQQSPSPPNPMDNAGGFHSEKSPNIPPAPSGEKQNKGPTGFPIME